MSNDASLLNTDLATELQEQPENKTDPNTLSKKIVGVLIALVVLSALVFVTAFALNKNDGGSSKVISPVKLTLALPPQSPFQLVLGESRVVEVLLFSGHDNRTAADFQQVTEREVVWSVIPVGVVEVDGYGRIDALKEGEVTVRVQSKKNNAVFAERTIEVVKKGENFAPLPKRVINYNGEPASLNTVQQKITTFMTLDQAKASDIVPQAIKDVIKSEQAVKTTQVTQQNGAKWTITKYADKSERTYIIRQNIKQENPLDWTMHLVGNRYLPGDGTEVLSITDDEAHNGIWTVNSQGVSHIVMETVSYKAKAERLLNQTQEKVMRHGLASTGQLRDGNWVGEISDNDGLWTSMFAAGEFMRYSSLKTGKFPDKEIAEARESALYSLKAILLTANIPMRDAIVDAKLRHYTNTRAGSGQKLSSSFLKQGKPFSVDTYSGSAVDGEGFFGVDAGKTVDGAYYGGSTKYTFEPTHKGDWSENRSDAAATSKRSLKGFMARTFLIESKDGNAPGGLFFRHREDGKQEVISGAEKLYDYTKDEHPILDLGNTDLPQILKDFVSKEQEGDYNRSDLIYKGDTSTDEVIGHLFIYKIAYDILDEQDPEELILKDLIRSTMVNFCTCLTNNDYTMVDATGQGTSWAKLTHTFLTSDYTLEDAPIKALQLLLSFKLCHYVTGDASWQQEYSFLIEDASFKYLDLIGAVWKRWTYRTFNEDSYSQLGVYHLDPKVDYYSETEIERHIIACIHFSDEEEAFLGYYLAFQLEDDPTYLQKYKMGLEGWWHSVSRSQNPLWYYIYQLAYPDTPKTDHYGNLLTEMASWQLSRHPVDTTKTTAFIEGARADVIIEGKQKLSSLSMDPSNVLGRRLQKSDADYFSREVNFKVAEDYDPMNIYEFKVLPSDERRLHKFNSASFEDVMGGSPNSIEACTIYTLPYWMGVYHRLLPLE